MGLCSFGFGGGWRFVVCLVVVVVFEVCVGIGI